IRFRGPENGSRRQLGSPDPVGEHQFPFRWAFVNGSVKGEVQYRIMVAAAHHWHRGAHKPHLAAFPFAPSMLGLTRYQATNWNGAKVEHVRAGKLGISKRRRFCLAGASAGGTNQNIAVGKVIGDQIGEPIWKIFMIKLICLNSIVYDFKVSSASL